MVEPYAVDFRPEAQDGLRRLSRSSARRVLDKIKWLSENCERIPHEALAGEFKGVYKLRVGDYRVLYAIIRKEKLVVVHLVGHRRSIYERR